MVYICGCRWNAVCPISKVTFVLCSFPARMIHTFVLNTHTHHTFYIYIYICVYILLLFQGKFLVYFTFSFGPFSISFFVFLLDVIDVVLNVQH